MRIDVLPATAGEIISASGIEEPSQIDIESIAFLLGAYIRRIPLCGCEGRIIGIGDRAVITVNSNASLGRQRFSAAHELGHWIKDRNLIASICNESEIARNRGNAKYGNHREVCANKFAADLLLPERMLIKRLVTRSHTLDSCSELADEFQTGLTATAIRLVQCNQAPSVAAFYEDGRRTWFVRNSLVPEHLWPRSCLAPGTVAHRLHSERTIYSIHQDDVDVSDWFDQAEAGLYSLVESSIALSHGLLSLLWWQDESHILSEIEDG